MNRPNVRPVHLATNVPSRSAHQLIDRAADLAGSQPANRPYEPRTDTARRVTR